MKKIFTAALLSWVLLWPVNCGNHESLFPESNPPELSQEDNFGAKIAVIGDTRSGGDNFKNLENDIADIQPRPDLVAHTGDIINDPGSGMEWEGFKKDASLLLDHFPFYPVPGNHDVEDQASQELYQYEFPAPVNNLYYELALGDVLLIFLDTELPGEKEKIINQQFDWLKNLLEQEGPNFKYRLAFLHRPLFPSAEHQGQSLDKYPELRDRLHQLFVTSNVQLVFLGHEHIYDRRQVDTVTYVTSGGGGAPLPDDPRAFYEYVFVEETGSGLQGYCFSVDGDLKDQFTIP